MQRINLKSIPKDFALQKRAALSEQLPVLREKLTAEKGWKQDVSNPAIRQSRFSRVSFRSEELERLERVGAAYLANDVNKILEILS